MYSLRLVVSPFLMNELLFYKPSLALFLLEINNENNEANGYLCCHD